MPNRSTRARSHALLTTVTALSALAVAAPAFAQPDTRGDTPATGHAQSSQAMPNAAPNSNANGNDADSTTASSNENGQETPPAQTLPEPKPSDYGASSFNAPSDAQLAQFTATHQTPTPNAGAAGSDNGDTNVPGPNDNAGTQSMTNSGAPSNNDGLPATSRTGTANGAPAN